MIESDKAKADKLRRIFVVHFDSGKWNWGEGEPISCWEPQVRFLHDEDLLELHGKQDVLQDHFVIRHPLHYSFAIVIEKEFGEKVLVLGDLPPAYGPSWKIP